MSVLVPSLINNHHHPHAPYFSSNTNRRLNGTIPQMKSNRLTNNKFNETDQTNDHVPHGVVSSMKQRLLNKVNESFVFNHNSTVVRHTLSKTSSRVISSNENLLQTKSSLSPLKQTARLSRSQDNLSNTNSINHVPGQIILNEQLNSYIQPKQDVIIVEATTNDQDHDHDDDEKLPVEQKTSTHKQSYTELHVDEAPKPGTVTTVKNMFERQIRLSRYDADKLFNASTPGSSRMSSQHRELSSPTRSRSISPNDMAVRQRRTMTSAPQIPLTSTTLSLPVPTSYPDLVISHTPPAETTKNSSEVIHNENLSQGINKEKKVFMPTRTTTPHEHIPLSVVTVDENSINVPNHHRPNLLLPSTSSSSLEIADSQPLDFKSRLALFNHTNTQKSMEGSISMKKPSNPTNSSSTNLLTKPVVHQPIRLINEEKKELQPETIDNHLTISISRSVINTAKAVTFFGGNKLNGNTKSSLPSSIPAPPPPPPPPSSSLLPANNKNDPSSSSTSNDVGRVPDIVGGNVRLNKSSIFSGAKKDARVQFIDNVDTFEYPSFEVAMAELGSTGSDNDNEIEDEDELSNTSNGDHNHKINGKMNDKQTTSMEKNRHADDVDDDELERLARINAKFNTNNLAEKPLKPKGTLHTFRPTHLDQYELGTQHGFLPTPKSSDISSSLNSYSILARQKLISSSDISTKTLSNHPMIKYQQKPMFDMANNIQWSSMSTTTDLLF